MARPRRPLRVSVLTVRWAGGRIGGDGSVGIWHETYQVPAGGYECVYVNMPRSGLAAASEHMAVSGGYHTARGRLGVEVSVAASTAPPPEQTA